ncbi:hypothetical protein GGI15_004153 [Coemansia interrupta]|uniref:E2F-associated phosphoprotein n=1 Tax=Coemansia interrupta TaxID=1126814 RepID=A0A9W8LGR5_9FUNG|nr:hypothetical protein GGI15_004153 [Coemansia interrupta]
MNIFRRSRSNSLNSNKSIGSSDESNEKHDVEKDELLDSDADDLDAEWVAQNHPGNTDAILSCPSCFTQICFVCQAHTRYDGQYRALSVEHCDIDDAQKYTFDSRGKLQEIDDANGQMSPPPINDKDIYRLVVCGTCKTKVGVIDHEDIYHLFHVIPDIQK